MIELEFRDFVIFGTDGYWRYTRKGVLGSTVQSWQTLKGITNAIKRREYDEST